MAFIISTLHSIHVIINGPADFLWVDADGLGDHAVPSAFARYYEEAASRLEEWPMPGTENRKEDS